MLAQGHKLKVGEVGIVGYATAQGEPRIALDVGKDAVFFDNPHLPETRSEMALPLIVGGELLGALDVQSRREAAFSQEDIAVLQVLADQVAVAIDNAHLFTELQEALEATQRAYGELSRAGWASLLQEKPGWGFRYSSSISDEARRISPVSGAWTGEMLQAAEHGKVTTAGNGTAIAVPIQIRGQVIGVLNINKSSPGQTWTADEINAMEHIADQLGQAMESARLYQDTQLRAIQEEMAREITTRIRESMRVETVLKSAVNAIGSTMGLAALEVHLGNPPTNDRNE
jgi:GAF domain-containing protein